MRKNAGKIVASLQEFVKFKVRYIMYSLNKRGLGQEIENEVIFTRKENNALSADYEALSYILKITTYRITRKFNFPMFSFFRFLDAI